jgi:hypothetical protein
MRQALSMVVGAALPSSAGPTSGDIAIAATAGIGLFLWGLAFLLWPDGIARANDTRGPRWLRDFSLHGPDPARLGRTSVKLVRRTGILLLVMGLILLIGIAIDAS